MKCFTISGDPARNEEHLLVSPAMLEVLKAGVELDTGNRLIVTTPLLIAFDGIPVYTSKLLAPGDAFHVSASGYVTRLSVSK